MTLSEEQDKAVADLIDRWHGGEAPGTDLREFVGMTEAQYEAMVRGLDIPGEYEVPSRPRVTVDVHGVTRSFPSRSQP